ncbi:MAG: hypothetical protein E7556_00895 [Ruminococcaceae bacterium]|nr:hypothetical protein [Oscillospiraceae bacterium]
MKRLLSSLLAIVFVIGVCVSAPITANAENGEMQEYTLEGVGIFQYDEVAVECYVKEWLGTDENLVLAGVIDINTVSYKITRILSGAFSNCENLKTIDLNSSNIEIIDPDAFAENVIVICDNPEKITTKPEDIMFHKSVDGNVHNIENYKIENDEIVGVCTCGVDSDVFATIEYENQNESGWARSAFVTPADGSSVSLSENDGFTSDALEITQDDVTDENGITIYLKPSENENAVNVSGDLSAKLDSTAPTGLITLGESNNWSTLLDTISFVLFFKEEKELTITADDADGSGVASVEYYVSAEQISDISEIIEWKTIGNDGAVSLDADSKNVIYAKITDNVGNVTYISSDGIVLYSDSVSENQTIEYTYNENSDEEISVTFNGNTVNSIKCNGVQLDNNNYTVDTDNNKITLNASYLNTLSVGEYSYTVSYNPQDEAYVEADGNEEPVTTEFLVKVNEAASLIETAPTAIENLVYTGEAQTLVTAGTAANGTIEYKLGEAEDAEWSTTLPVATDAGDYNVYYRVVGNENYNDVEVSEPVIVTIDRKTITDEMVTLSGDFVYNGAEQKPTISVDGLTLDTDYTVKYKRGETATDDFINVGEITVVVTGKGNYQGTAESSYKIEQATVSISEINVSDREYNGKTDVEIIGSDITGVVDADGGKVSIDFNDVKANVDDSLAGNDKEVVFTGSPVLTGEKSSNYKLSELLPETTVTINKKQVTITAKDVSVVVNGEKPTLTEYEADNGLVTGDAVISATLVAKDFENTATVKDYDIEVSEAVIKNASGEDVTDSYDVKYLAGKLSVIECTHHQGGTATCKEQAICTICKQPYGEVNAENHEITKWTETTPATCVTKGVESGECDLCEKTVTRETEKNPDAHTLGFRQKKAPNCNESGELEIYCKNGCGYCEIEGIEPDGTSHDWSGEWVVTTPATCKAEGVKTKECANGCGEKQTMAIPVDSESHNMSEWEVTPATCVEEGLKARSCKNGCGHTETETLPIDKDAHKLSGDWTVVTQATCVTDGEKVQKCLNDGCTHSVTEVIPADGTSHNLGGWEITIPVQCTVKGEIAKFCKNGDCDYKLTEEVQPDGKTHTFDTEYTIVPPTCVKVGEKYRACVNPDCTEKRDVEEIEIDLNAHEKTEVINAKEPTCLEDGYTGDEYCPACETVIAKGEVLKATGHKVSDWITDKEPTFTTVGKQHKECTVCKAELQTAIIEKRTLDTPKVTIENVSDGIKVKWTQDEDATGYIVYSSQYDVKTKKWSKWKNRGTIKAEASSWVDEKVKKNVKYKYTVRAVNGDFKSAYKESNSITFIPAPKATVTISTTGLLVKWNKIDGADSYIVYRSEKKNSKWTKWSNLGTTGEAKNTWLDDKVKSGATYRYAIRAVDNKIKSGYIATSGMIFLEQPTLTISNTAEGIIGSWEKVAGAKGYTIYRSELVSGKWTNWINLGTTKETAKSFTDKTVKSGKQYKYTLRAVNGKVKSTYKSSDALMYLAEPVLKIKNEANAITGSWTQVKGAKGYSIYRSELKDGKWTKWVNLGTAKETAKTFTDKTVKSGVTYKYTVKAINGKYKSSFVSTSKLVFLSLPTVKVANNATGVKVTWNKITGAESYIVYRREYKSDKWTKWKNLGSTEKNSFIDSTAVSNTKYQYTVRAVNGGSKSVYKASSTLRYIAAPVVILEGDKTDIKVLWAKVDGAKNYTVYRAVLGEDGKWSSWQKMADVKETKSSWIDKSTEEDVVYRYTVRAVNGKIKSAYIASEPFMIESEEEPEKTPETEQK